MVLLKRHVAKGLKLVKISNASRAGQTYFRMASTHCSTPSEEGRQKSVIKLILRLKDFSERIIKNMEFKRKTKKDVSEQKKRKFLGTVTFDSLTNNHGRIKRIFKLLNKERYYLPMSVPDVKFKQYIFSLRKMKRKLGIQ